MDELKNLNELNKGIHKQWVWGNKDSYYRSCDYLQKINYCIHDLNREFHNSSEKTMKELVFMIVLVDWICEACTELPKILRKDIVDKGNYLERAEVVESLQFFKALRSFVVAHPLGTNRHGKFGLDGDWICVDIMSETSMIAKQLSRDSDWYHLDFEGLRKSTCNQKADYVLKVYSKKADRMRFFKYIGIELEDLCHVAELQISQLYDLDLYLSKLKKKDFEVKM